DHGDAALTQTSQSTFLVSIRPNRLRLKHSAPLRGILTIARVSAFSRNPPMRLTALALAFAVALAAAAQEPKKNPSRDGTTAAAPEAAKAKPDPVKQAPRVIRGAEAGVGRLVPDVAFT